MILKKENLSISFNGKKYLISVFNVEGLSVLHLLLYFNYKLPLVVIELNGKVLKTQDWYKVLLKNNDFLEVVTIVGGG